MDTQARRARSSPTGRRMSCRRSHRDLAKRRLKCRRLIRASIYSGGASQALVPTAPADQVSGDLPLAVPRAADHGHHLRERVALRLQEQPIEVRCRAPGTGRLGPIDHGAVAALLRAITALSKGSTV